MPESQTEVRLFYILAALFIIVPVAELKILWAVGNKIGIMPTLGLVVLTGIVGSWLAKRQGARVINDIRNDLQAGKMPADNLIGGALVLVGGVLLITPGICTDIVGLLLMLPPIRRGAAKIIKIRFSDKLNIVTINNFNNMSTMDTGNAGSFSEATETEAKVIEDENEPQNN